MRLLAATLLLIATACGGSQAKTEDPIVKENGDVPAACCCKTTPETDDKEIKPAYATAGRMECSTEHGECVDDVQCAASKGQGPDSAPTPSSTGVPPPPNLPSGK